MTKRTFADAQTDLWTRIVLGALMLVVAAVSVGILSQQSLRLDEAQSLWQTSHTWSRMLTVIAGDVHVPVYHTLLHVWQIFVGNSVFAGRMLSLFFFLLTIPAVYLLGMAAFGRRSIALFAAVLVASSPFLNWYGSEIRMYSLLTLLMVVNQYFFVRIYKDRPSSAGIWWGYGITAALGLFTHYFFALGLVAQVVFYAMNARQFPTGSFRRFASLAMFLTVLLSLWLFYVYRVGAIGESKPHLAEPTIVNLFNTFSQFVFGFQNDHINTLIVSLWPLSVLFAFLVLTNDKRLSTLTTYFLIAAILPVILVFVLSITIRPLYLARYLILTVPSLYLFLSWAFSTYIPSVAKVLRAGLIVLIALTFLHQTTSADTPVKENYKEASEHLMAYAKPQDVVILSAPFTVYPIEYYYRGSASITTLPLWDRYQSGGIPLFSEERLPQEVEKIRGEHQNAYLLLSYDQGYEEAIKLYFETHFERLSQHEFSPKLNLYVYKLKYN